MAQNGHDQKNMSIRDIMDGMDSNDNDQVLNSVKLIRRLSSNNHFGTVDSMCWFEIIPRCVNMLDSFHPDIQFGAMWILSNIVGNDSELISTVANCGAIEKLVQLFVSPHQHVADQAVWTLVNLIGEGRDEYDAVLLSDNVIEMILNFINFDITSQNLGNISWFISYLIDKTQNPFLENLDVLLPALVKLMSHTNRLVASDAARACQIVINDKAKIQAAIDFGCVKPLIKLLTTNCTTAIIHALHVICHLVTGTESQIDAIIAAGVLQPLLHLLQSNKDNIVKDTLRTLKNITSNNMEHIQYVVDTGFFPHIKNILKTGDVDLQKEAAWIISNTITNGTQQQVCFILKNFDILRTFSDLLEAKDLEMVKMILGSLTDLFRYNDKLEKIEQLESFDLWIIRDKLRHLQNHKNEDISNEASHIITKYLDKLSKNALENSGCCSIEKNVLPN